jgi:hypothetical protein
MQTFTVCNLGKNVPFFSVFYHRLLSNIYVNVQFYLSRTISLMIMILVCSVLFIFMP